MKNKFRKKCSTVLGLGTVIISVIVLQGAVGNHAAAAASSQPLPLNGQNWIGSANVTVNIKPVITTGVVIGSKTVSGTAAPGATVDLYTNIAVGNFEKVTITADAKGNWIANLATGLTAGNITAYATLDGQNWLMSDDTTVNTKPVITTGVVIGSKTVSGTAAAGATVDLYTTEKDTVTADAKGNWTVNLTTGLPAGNIYAWSATNGQNWLRSDVVTVVV